MLGHVISGVEGVYDRHAYEAEKAAALDKLAALIDRIVNPPEGQRRFLSDRRSGRGMMPG